VTDQSPTLAGFIAFIRTNMGISTTILPDDSAVIPVAYAVALEIVNIGIQGASALIYQLAVYNLGGSNLINYAQDLPDAPVYKNKMKFFAYVRAQWNTLGFVSGVIQSSADESTSESLVVQEAAKNFTLMNLQQLKDPWGRQFLAFSQSFGPSVWGLT
jgi:uncharacterized protein YciU (UPF0263 family)